MTAPSTPESAGDAIFTSFFALLGSICREMWPRSADLKRD
jgi:hypothetical protein